MSMNAGARADRSAEMNVTPLIDVLLVLIIIFMVIIPVQHRGERADIPQASGSQASPSPSTIVVRLVDAGPNKQPVLKINQEQVAWDALESRLRALYQSRAEKVAFLRGDPEIDFEYVAQVVDVAHHAGADRVGLLGASD
jgi:biopolymer transport protein TolR